MNIKDFELLFRDTWFAAKLLVATWDVLSTSERIDLMLNLDGLPDELKEKALNDPNPVVRMLAIKKTNIDEDDEPELYAKVNADKSLFVRAALRASSFLLDADDLMSLTHIERLGAIALSDGISNTSFAKFIIEGLGNQHISEDEAAQLVDEFVLNPNLHKGFDYEPLDGDDWHTKLKNFEAIWNLTTCTPSKVHSVIAEAYPLEFSFDNTIPCKILDSMSQYALEMLAHRGYKPLLRRIEKKPESFTEEVRRGAQTFKEFANVDKMRDRSGIEQAFDELREFRSEVNERFDKIDNQIAELLSSRKGLFS